MSESPSPGRQSRLTTSSDLLRRLNPKHTTEHLNSIISLAPDLTEDLLSSVDQPLAVKRCKQTGRDYLLCDYNRDGDSYRSPWSNQFDPPLDGEGGVGGVGAGGSEGAGEGAIPSERVRKMEVGANEAFDLYRDLYYEGGVSSVYFWNLDDGFAGVVLLKKCEYTNASVAHCPNFINTYCSRYPRPVHRRRLGLHPCLRSYRARPLNPLQADLNRDPLSLHLRQHPR
jgi:hypothetical protein